jgi:cell division protein FtsW
MADTSAVPDRLLRRPNPFSEAIRRWWSEVDRLSILMVILLVLGGVVLQLAASPGVTHKLGMRDPFFFFTRHMQLLPFAVVLMLGLSVMSTTGVRRIALAGFCVSFVALLLLPLIGHTENGATRWLLIGGQSFQPSEVLKPTFVVFTAWMLSKSLDRPGGREWIVILALLAVIALFLYRQPDIGQLILLTAIVLMMMFLAGMSWLWVSIISVVAPAAGYFFYRTVPHVKERINSFLGIGTEKKSDQVLDAQAAIERGGVFGVGPVDAEVKRKISDAHTDYIVAVAAEEYGLIAGLLLIAVFAVLVLNSLRRAAKQEDTFTQIAASGLAGILGLQAFINIGVGLTIVPAKGMTLPFVSAGGSSMLATALTVGFLLALTRRRAYPTFHST